MNKFNLNSLISDDGTLTSAKNTLLKITEQNYYTSIENLNITNLLNGGGCYFIINSEFQY